MTSRSGPASGTVAVARHGSATRSSRGNQVRAATRVGVYCASVQRGTDGAGKNSRSRAPQGRKGEDERAHGGGHEGRQSSARSSRRQSRGQAALRDNRRGQTQPVRGPEVLLQDKVRSGVTRMFATVVPGMAQAVARELDHREGVQVTDAGFDGRSDLILFDVERGHREGLLSLRTVEDLFVEVGRTMRSSGDKSHWIAGRIWRPVRVEKALSVRAAEVRPLAGTMTFRVIARVLQERSFLRTELRRALGEAIRADKPRWRVADPSDLEVWISEYQAGPLRGGTEADGRVDASTSGPRGRAAGGAAANGRRAHGEPRRCTRGDPA